MAYKKPGLGYRKPKVRPKPRPVKQPLLKVVQSKR